MALIIGLVPVLVWGLIPTILSKIGGKPANQILGVTMGSTIAAVIVFFATGTKLPTGFNLFLCVLSGFGWGFGQTLAFKGYQLVGSSIVMPITTAFQLIATALWGAFALNSWSGILNKTIGIVALLVIILGATLTTWTEHRQKTNSAALRQTVILLLVGTIGYWLYSAAPQVPNLTWAKGLLPKTEPMTALEVFLPQVIGMLLAAILYALLNIKKQNAFVEKVTYKQIVGGLLAVIAALAYLSAAQPQMLGLSNAFVLSQVSVVVATLTGIYMLKQTKTHKEMIYTNIGLALIVIAASVTAII